LAASKQRSSVSARWGILSELKPADFAKAIEASSASN
jgi:hypothetical protein